MKIKNILTIALTKRVLLAIEKMINLRCSIRGEENIPKAASIIFAANHFTRSETFILPYFLNKIEGIKFCRSLAHSSLFTSYLGKYLRNLETISTNDENRNQIIVSDLAQNKYNWVIYPEGQMMKDRKRDLRQGILQNRLTIKTGTAVLAMQAEFIRQEQNLPNPVCIVPTTISYIPVHPEDNAILQIARRFAKKIPKRLEEELTVEGSLLLHSNIIIHFHEPIYIMDYIIKDSYINKLLNLTKDNIQNSRIEKYRIPIAIKVADEIYRYAQMTHEHIISLLLKNLKTGDKIKRKNLQFLIISTVLQLRKHSNIKEFSEHLSDEKLFLLSGNEDRSIHKFLSLLQNQCVIRVTKNNIETEPKFYEDYTFETVRIENISKVFLNEIGYFTNTDTIADNVFKMNKVDLAKLLFSGIEEFYYKKHKITYNPAHSIDVKHGKPVFLENKDIKRAILLIHGYKASPGEVKELAEYLHTKGMTCYAVRMAGHGTSPFDMANTTYEEWISSCQVAYNILKYVYGSVDIIGFSTGGLIAMQIARTHEVRTLTLINSAMQLCDIRFRYVKYAKLWSDLSSKFFKNHKGYIQDTPFYPDTNYSINHFSSMNELSTLMDKCKETMYEITCDTLIIHSDHDPVVNPESGKMIINGISSKTKMIEMIDSNEHVITRGKELKKISDTIARFLL